MREDQKFVYEIMKKVNKTVYNPTVCYNINFTDKSLSRSVPTRYHLAQLDVSEYIYSELSDEEAKKMARAYMVYLCLTVFVPYYNGGDFTKEDISRVNCIIKDNIGVTFLKGSMTTRIKLLLYLISPSLLRYVFLKRESLKRDRV